MKKFVFSILFFTLILLGLAFIADFVISNNLRSYGDNISSGLNEIYSGKLQNDIVIVGSSRAFVQYNPQILDSILGVNSYNLGTDGGAINRQIIKYNFYRQFNDKPKVIIQNIDYGTMGITSGFQREQFFPYFSVSSIKTEVFRYENLNILEKYFPFFRYYGKDGLILTAIGILKVKKLYKGFLAQDMTWDGSRLAQLTEINYSKDSLALLLFDEYLAKAYSENIKIIFVYAPVYIGAADIIKNIEEMRQMYESIAVKYDIPILDYYTYDSISYDIDYFYNANHMNRKGAELFSTKLAHDIDSLGIIVN